MKSCENCEHKYVCGGSTIEPTVICEYWSVERGAIEYHDCSYGYALTVLNHTERYTNEDIASAIVKIRKMATDNAVTKKMYRNAIDFILGHFVEVGEENAD